ncbi:hypothetical protein JL721_6933 [Aureococcus anophagefferens]|nr:hypothetical protein JL721_6933 [Aureococcus anophagefferens]
MGSGGDVEAPGDGSSGDEKAPESSDSEDDGSGSAHDEVKEPERRSGKARGAAVPDFVAIPVVKFHLRKEAATQAAYQVVIALYVQQAFHGKIGEIQDIKGFVALASDIVFAAFYLGAAATITGAYYCRAPARRSGSTSMSASINGWGYMSVEVRRQRDLRVARRGVALASCREAASAAAGGYAERFVAFVHGSSEIPLAVLTAYEERSPVAARAAGARPRPQLPIAAGRRCSPAQGCRSLRPPRARSRRRRRGSRADGRVRVFYRCPARDMDAAGIRPWRRDLRHDVLSAALLTLASTLRGAASVPPGAGAAAALSAGPARARTAGSPRSRCAKPFLNPVVFKKGIPHLPVHFGGEARRLVLRRLLTNRLWWTAPSRPAAAGLGSLLAPPAAIDGELGRRGRTPTPGLRYAAEDATRGGRDQDAGRAQVVMGAMAQLGVTYEVAIGGLYWVCIKVPMALLLCLGVALMCALQICADVPPSILKEHTRIRFAERRA